MPGPRPGRLRSLFLMTAWMGWLTTAMAFKTGDFPIEMINSNNSTVTQLANKAIADNMAYDIKQMNSIPDPALNKTRENETGENANETGENANETDAEGLGGLGRSRPFACARELCFHSRFLQMIINDLNRYERGATPMFPTMSTIVTVHPTFMQDPRVLDAEGHTARDAL